VSQLKIRDMDMSVRPLIALTSMRSQACPKARQSKTYRPFLRSLAANEDVHSNMSDSCL